VSRLSRRALLGASAGLGLGAFAPNGLRLSSGDDDQRHGLWRRGDGPHLRGAVFVQRRVYRELDGPTFLGPGPLGAPITDAALDRLAASGANLASWSGPGPFGETAPFDFDPVIETHIATWLDRCLARGLFTTLCFRSGPGRSAFAFHPEESWYPARLYDDSLWRDEEKQAAWVRMVEWTFERFGDHPALAGVLALEEPNAFDLGHPDVWPRMAARIANRISGRRFRAPLLLSPDRWARLEQADTLRSAVGSEPVLVTHDYSPWRYTHAEEGAQVRYDRRSAGAVPPRGLGQAGVLEFGAPADLPDLTAYLTDRIAAYEAAGLNWAAFRWTSGWAPYEREQGRRALSENPAALGVLQAAFAANRVRPSRA
jgi:hypothetical protein